VDAADYVVWRKLNGTLTTLPNDSTPGIVSPADYDEWMLHFGMSSGGAGSSTSAVPEPATLTAALVLVGCRMAQQRRGPNRIPVCT
jgi:hypothetical protein